MPAQYPFIDVAVHESVRARFARGEALVVFAPALDKVLWANGVGARFFGNASIYDFIEDGPNRSDVTFRQIEGVARQLSKIGDIRPLLMRVGSGFQRVPVSASVEMVELRKGEPVVLLAVPLAAKTATTAERAIDMLAGFDDPDTHMAVLDGDGAVVAASANFTDLGVTPHTARMLVNLVGADAHHLIKRPTPTGRGYLPAAIGKLSDDPALHLLFVVETILGTMDPTDGFEVDEAEPEVSAETPEAPLPVSDAVPEVVTEAEPVAEEIQPSTDARPSPGGFADVVEALGDIEEIEESAEELAEEAVDASSEFQAEAEVPVENDDSQPVDEAQDVSASLVETVEPENMATPEVEEPEPAAEQLVSTTSEDKVTPAEPATAGPISAPTKTGFIFSPSRRAVRFVWKIDADGRFCDVSDEFAQAVGPRAADINGVAFTDLAALFNLDPDGKIAELLKKRDTWSGKTIHWPIEGTPLMVPVDLAALPTYTRSRDFDGFRGFGIVRFADAIEDPNHTGLTFFEPGHTVETEAEASGEIDAAPANEDSSLEHAEDRETENVSHETESASQEGELAISIPEEAASETTAFETEPTAPVSVDVSAEPVEETAGASHEAPAQEVPVFRTPAYEPPALQIAETPSRRHSDKVVQLEERRMRERDGLTVGEKAAFEEIARKLDPLGLRLRRDEGPVTPPGETGIAGAEKQTKSSEGNSSAAGMQPTPATEPVVSARVAETTANAPQPVSAEASVIRLKRDNSLTAEIIDLMPVALLVHVGDRLIHANPEFLALTGYASLDELQETGGIDALIQRQDLDQAGSEAGQIVVVRADDTLVPVTARLQSVKFDDASALMLALVPVSGGSNRALAETATVEEPQAQQAAAEHLAHLQVEVDELRSILETATDGVVIIDADGVIRSMNRAASALFNFDEEETRGKPFVMLFAHESQKSILDYLGGLSGHGVASVLNDGREVIGREASGGFLPLFMTIGRLTSSNGFCAVIRDITQWKRTEEDLRSAKRAAETASAHKTDFLARVSHEIRTPLNAIIGFADMMANEHFGPVGHPRYNEYANDIVRSGRHVLDIVNDLLDISKIEAGEMDLDFTAVGLNETVSAAVAIVQPQANSQRVIIRTALSQSVPNVVADLRSIKQIVLNILANAIRFTPSGGQIIVSTAYEANGSVALRIRDTGIGMTRSELEQAMKPFRQVSAGARNRGDGTGLGLPLTKAMVDANRANFSISSAPNEGTLVEITFPSPRVLAD
ncbi:PAS domain S-box protein [Rhizobium daejeonense]|uniref:histidine kinase n=1 Tax=Rhizobium daejeonense TaxID=240521 RepID=A0A6M1RYI0_9HYPH|nr:ATP-binding protein [Rhizobium daejeonense]NGO63793.1 PAS domain S-box protein [Rhizobium daejeonense]